MYECILLVVKYSNDPSLEFMLSNGSLSYIVYGFNVECVEQDEPVVEAVPYLNSESSNIVSFVGLPTVKRIPERKIAQVS